MKMFSTTNIVRLFFLAQSTLALSLSAQTEEEVMDNYLGNYYSEEIDPSDFSHAEFRSGIFRLEQRSRMAMDNGAVLTKEKNIYIGSPYKSFSRSTAWYKNYSFNVTMEKDVGEKALTDFVSGCASAEKLGMFDKLILGDYVLEYGQGLVLWRSTGPSKGSDVTRSPRKSARGAEQYSSTDEEQFFRGTAGRILIGDFFLDAFWSKRTLDASLDAREEIRSLDYDGYHRTPGEVAKKNIVRESLAGGAVGYNYAWCTASLYGYSSGFSNAFVSSEKLFHAAGVAFDVNLEGLAISSELAFAPTRSPSGVINFLITEESSEILLALRHISADAPSLHSYGFGERAIHQTNEEGVYIGVKQQLGKDVAVRMYVDQYKTLMPTSTVPQTARGVDFFSQCDYELSPSLSLLLRARYERSDEAVKIITVGTLVSALEERTHCGARVEFRLRKEVETRMRVEVVQVESPSLPPQRGLLSFIEARLPLNTISSLIMRAVAFSTTSYDARLYEFESNAPGAMSNVMLYGTGFRFSARVTGHVSEWCTVNGKYEQTVTGGGNHLGDASSASRVTVQVDVVW